MGPYESDDDVSEEVYQLCEQDHQIVAAARQLLLEISRWKQIRANQLEVVSKILQVLDRLPSVSDELFTSVLLTGPRRHFGDHKIYHWWNVEVEGQDLTVSSGGYFHRPSTGGDSFTCMTWSATPGYETEYSDYLQTLQIVDDAQPFESEVMQLALGEPGYSLEISVNGEEIDLPDEDEDDEIDEADDCETSDDARTTSDHFDRKIIRFDRDTTIRWSFQKGDFLLWMRAEDMFSSGNDVTIVDVWELSDGDFATITNRPEDLPSWFKLHPTEASGSLAYKMKAMLDRGYEYEPDPLEAPNLWRAYSGDRIACLGKPRTGAEGTSGVLSILDFERNALLVGDSNRTDFDLVTFGGFNQSNQTEEQVKLCRAGVLAVQSLGPPNVLPDIGVAWSLGS